MTMAYRVMYGDQAIGFSELEYRDSAMAIAFGRFYPLAAYQSVRLVFLMFTGALPDSGGKSDEQKLAAYYAARDGLGLALAADDGATLTTSGVHIVDWGEREEDQMEIQVHVTDLRFWEEGITPQADAR